MDTWDFTILDCELAYSLVPTSEIDNNYCVYNWLCSLSWDSYTWNWSALYINEIQHLSDSNININIPEEIDWDYEYTESWMNINISWYNVDYDKITNIINTQNYKPTTEDFNYIISSVIPLFVPWLVIILFLYWIFKFIKKIF